METYKDITCTFCGCTCDDIEVTVENNKIIEVKRGCVISTEKFLHCQEHRLLEPLKRVNGKLEKTSLTEALDKAAGILADAKYPLLFGWSCTSNEAVGVGIELAEDLGGVMDNQTTICHGPGLEAVQELGESSCTLGEIRHRADLIIYWGCNPSEAHPRHLSRYSTIPKGKFREGKKDRKLVLVDARRTSTTRVVDMFIQVEPGKDFELITALRMAIRDEEIESEKVANVPIEQIEKLADMMVSCEFGIIFFGLGLTHSVGKSENVGAALSLVRDLNAKTKFLIMPLRGHFNVTGSNKILAWQMGYPFAVDFSHGYPRYNPGETSAVDLLNRGDCDAALIVASDPVAHMPRQAITNLSKIPIVVIDPLTSATSFLADVHIPSAFIGVECEGTIYRMDGVPILTRKVVEPPPNCLPDIDIIKELLSRVRKLRGVT